MFRPVFISCLILVLASNASGQEASLPGSFTDLSRDTIILHEQPQWTTSLPIFNYCSFYEETGDVPFNFEAIKKAVFIPYSDSLRRDRPSNRPLVIEWLRFTIRNASTDTIHLRIDPGTHYFVHLYDDTGSIARSGIYETTVDGYEKASLPLRITPLTTRTLWIRSEDRMGHLTPAWVSLDTNFSFYKKSLESARRDRLLFLLLAILTGCLFFIGVFAAWQYYLYRDSAFLWYIGYTTCAGFTGLFWIDIRHLFGLFPSYMHDLIFSVFLFVVPVLYSLFINKMLNLREQFGRTFRLIQFLMMVCLLQAIIEFVTVRSGTFIFTEYYGYVISMVPVAILNVVLLVLAALSNEKVKWFMFCGVLSMLVLWCMPMLVFLSFEFRMDMVSMVLVFIPFYMLSGLTAEAICFSFAISYRSKLVWVEKNSLQVQYSAQLKEALERRTLELQEQNRLMEDQKLRQVQTTFEKRLAEIEMTALRAQMNPHFIFNCLNSIKLYTLESDSQSAAEYLTKFSQLIRLVLENSRSEKITLQREIETLRLYIDMEAMRFKDKVRYRINVAPEIDQLFTELPPLLIQPYVENAIWHGLMHKKDGGAMSIQITQPGESYLQVEITDNGVGRAQSAIYKSKSATRQKSFGLKMTSERIEMLNQMYGIQANVTVADLKDDSDIGCGTRVIIKIPV